MQLFFKLRKVGDYYAFDAGIPAWANAYPADTLLVGKVITDPEKQLIPKSELKKVTVDFETFKKKAAEGYFFCSKILVNTEKSWKGRHHVSQ